MNLQRLGELDNLALRAPRTKVGDQVFGRDEPACILFAKHALQFQVLRVRQAVRDRQPVGRIDRNGCRIALRDVLAKFIVDAVVHEAVVVALDGAADFVRAEMIEQIRMSAASEDRPLNAAFPRIGEDYVTPDGAEMQLHRTRVAGADDVDPHVHIVVAHGAGQDHVEFLAPDEVQDFGLGLQGLHNRIGGASTIAMKACDHRDNGEDFQFMHKGSPCRVRDG